MLPGPCSPDCCAAGNDDNPSAIDLQLISVEYFGINGDSGYDDRTKHKIQVYKNAGIDGLFLISDSLLIEPLIR
jgi:hypothetical protein